MNRAELRQALDDAGVPDGIYDLHDRYGTDGSWIMLPDDEGWTVYYSEHGITEDMRHHPDEASACADMWERLAWARKDSAKQRRVESEQPVAPEQRVPARRSWLPWRR